MSWSERNVRNHRQQTDCAIHTTYAHLASYPHVLESFHEILQCVRTRAPRLLEAPVANGHHPGIYALAYLACFRSSHIRPAVDWPGTSASWRPAVASLAHHLVCQYSVPMFLSAAWYAFDPAADKKRSWFVAHSRGAVFRSLDLPLVMTRKMEHIFLSSQDHLSIDHAMRRAELLAMGMPTALAQAILATPLATDLRHSDFWRTVWLFLIANADDVDPAQIGPMIDYIQAVRHNRATIETFDGLVEIGPPQPAFSMKGRTMHSMKRLMQDWHRGLRKGGPSFSWSPSPFRSLLFEEPTEDGTATLRRWQIVELTTSAQLRSEGAALRHCVASYANRCYAGTSSIWSLRSWRGEKMRRVLTIEVDPAKRHIIQARGLCNRYVSGKPRRLLHDWAIQEKLRLGV